MRTELVASVFAAAAAAASAILLDARLNRALQFGEYKWWTDEVIEKIACRPFAAGMSPVSGIPGSSDINLLSVPPMPGTSGRPYHVT